MRYAAEVAAERVSAKIMIDEDVRAEDFCISGGAFRVGGDRLS
jgi:hypothetical protein